MPDLKTEDDVLDYLDRKLEQHNHVALTYEFLQWVWDDGWAGLAAILSRYLVTINEVNGETALILSERPDEMTHALALTTKEQSDD